MIGGKYDDIINMPHHVSRIHEQMSMANRAAQFAPFSALSGHNEALSEVARYTESKIELSKDELDTLNHRISYLIEHMDMHPLATITYFCPDPHKPGGYLIKHTGHIRKIEEYERRILLEDNTSIPLDDILYIEYQDIKEG